MQNDQLFILAGAKATRSRDSEGYYLKITVRTHAAVRRKEARPFLHSISCAPIFYDETKKEYHADARQLLIINKNVGDKGATSKKRFFFNSPFLALFESDGKPFPYIIMTEPQGERRLQLKTEICRYTP